MLLLLFLLNMNFKSANWRLSWRYWYCFCANIREKAEEIARIRSELKEKGLVTFVAHSTYSHWYVYWFTVWSLIHSLSSSLDPLAIISLLIHPHAHSLILSYLVHLTFLVIINYTVEGGEWTVVHIDSVLCLSSHHQKPLATTSILSSLVCHSMNIISMPVIYYRDLSGPWFSSFWDNFNQWYICVLWLYKVYYTGT